LKKNHVYYEMLEIPGAGHGLGGGDQQAIMKARLRSYDFINEVLSGKLPAAPPGASGTPATRPSAEKEAEGAGPNVCRSASRGGGEPDAHSHNFGFRIVLCP
jgi:hypothetical protein